MSARWVDVCGVEDIEPEDVIEIEHDGRALAVYRTAGDAFYATDALCTHERARLADGLVTGTVIECPKHNGRFDFTTGEAVRVPARTPLCTYPARSESGRVLVALG